MAGIRKIHIIKDELNKLYQKYSAAKIAEIKNCGETLIHKRIKEYNIVLKGVGKGGHRKKKGKIFSKNPRFRRRV